MKRIIGIIGVVILSMALGVSIAWARREGLSLISSLPSALVDGEG